MGQARSIFRAPVVAWRGLGCTDASPHSISELLTQSLRELSPLALPSSWRHKAARQGRWYMASSDSHVEYGSGEERDLLMWLEFQISPVAICHSPVTVLPARDFDEEPATAALGYRDPMDLFVELGVDASRLADPPKEIPARIRSSLRRRLFLGLALALHGRGWIRWSTEPRSLDVGRRYDPTRDAPL